MMWVVHSLLLLVACLPCLWAQTGPGLSCLCVEELEFSGNRSTLNTVVDITHAGDGSGRLFGVEITNQVWMWNTTDDTRYPEPYADFSGLYLTWAIAFHPDYANNGRVFTWAGINHTQPGDPSIDYRSHVLEYQVSSIDKNKLNTSSHRDLFNIQCGNGDCHMAGFMFFGSDNYLYFGHGDGPDQYDPPNNGQNTSNPYGALFRIDVDSRTGDLEYGIPPDNPFISDPDGIPEMYAYGFRNPYTAMMDEGDRITGEGYGRIFVADVGQDMWEEVSILENGGNYGWSTFEGSHCNKPEYCDDIGPHILPIAEYNHTVGQSIAGSTVYRGTRVPDLQGWYFLVDTWQKVFMQMRETSPGVWSPLEIIPLCSTCPSGSINDFPFYVIMLGTDEQGELYMSASIGAFSTWWPGTRMLRVSNPGTV